MWQHGRHCIGKERVAWHMRPSVFQVPSHIRAQATAPSHNRVLPEHRRAQVVA